MCIKDKEIVTNEAKSNKVGAISIPFVSVTRNSSSRYIRITNGCQPCFFKRWKNHWTEDWRSLVCHAHLTSSCRASINKPGAILFWGVSAYLDAQSGATKVLASGLYPIRPDLEGAAKHHQSRKTTCKCGTLNYFPVGDGPICVPPTWAILSKRIGPFPAAHSSYNHHFASSFIFTYSPYDSQLCPAHSSRWPACHSSTARWAARDNQELSLEKSKPVRAGGLWETIQEGDLKWVCAKVCEYANDQTMGAPGLKPWLQHCHTWASIQASTWLVEPPVPDMINDSEPTTSHGPRKLFTTKPRLFCL